MLYEKQGGSNLSNKIKVINNVKSIVGFNIDPTGSGFRSLPKQGTFIFLTEEEINYIHVNQSIIQKGLVWIEDKDTRVKLGLEDEEGNRENSNIIQHKEIVELVEGHHKTLESALNKIDEPTILQQFVEVARDLKIDSISKIKAIEKASNMMIFPDEE